MSNPLNSYIRLSRLIFNVEPAEVWEDCDEFEEDFRQLYSAILCKNCGKILTNPVVPKKHHFSCQHRVCLDCIGKKRSMPDNCKMCNDFTLFEKSQQTNLLLRCFQELCDLVQSSWIYEYLQRRTNHDTGQSETPNMLEIIHAGMSYGRISAEPFDETSSDESSSGSEIAKEPPNVFPNISPLSPVKSSIVQSQPEQISIIPEPVVPVIHATSPPPLPPTLLPAPQIVQYQSQIVQSQLPSTSKLTPPVGFIRSPIPRMPQLLPQPKPVMPPIKIQQAALQPTFSTPPQTSPTIYSVMYTGSGNKITLKRKPPEDVGPPPMVSAPASTSNNMTIFKTENVMSSNFKRPIQSPTVPNVITTTPTSSSATTHSNPNDQKRRGCRCGNATAAPGKLTCCGQRCPCYVDSKACIDCKCKGCRNPHYVDGHKKMRHQPIDPKTQQQQQQSFLASLHQQTSLVKDPSKPLMPSTSVIKTEDFNLIEPAAINNCIISMNSNGQYQIKPTTPQSRLLMKDQVKTMSPLMFPAASPMHQSTVVTTIGGINQQNIQILGVYSQVPMGMDKKIIIKNEPSTASVVTFTETTKQHFETTTTSFATSNLNTNLL